MSGGNWHYDLGLWDDWTLQHDLVIEGTVNALGGNINGFGLTSSSLTLGNTPHGSAGTLNLNGGSLTVENNLYQNQGTLDLNSGILSVNGNLIQTDGTLYVNGGRLNVAGNYWIQTESGGSSYGYLKMINPADYVQVGGNFVTRSKRVHSGYLTAGTLEVKGDFTERYAGSFSNFIATGTHKVLLSGTGAQTVDFQIPDPYFNILEITNTSAAGINFVLAKVRKELKSTTTPIVNGINLYLSGTAIVSGGNWHYDLGLWDDWTLQHDLVIEGTVNALGGNINGFGLTSSSLTLGNTPHGSAGTLNLNGGSLTVENNLYQNQGTLDLNSGILSVNGNLIQTDGTLYVNGGRLNVIGNYWIQTESGGSSYGYLKMINPADYVQVGGNFVTRSKRVHSGYLTAGTLEVKGDFTERYAGSFSNFIATGTHKVLLSGTGAQTVDFQIPDPYFNILEITNTSAAGINFVLAKVRKELKSTTTPIVNGINLYLSGTAIVSGGNWHYDLGLWDDWTLQHDLVIEGTVNALGGNINGFGLTSSSLTLGNTPHGSAGTLNLNGGSLTVENNLYQNQGTLDLNSGILSVNGNLIQTDGTLYVNGGRLNVIGNYWIQTESGGSSYGYLKMVNSADYVQVGGNFVTRSKRVHSGYLTAGTLEVKGDFTQKYGAGSFYNFVATGTHKVLLSGSGAQRVSFEDYLESKFNILELTKPFNTGYVFNYVPVWNRLIEPSTTLQELKLSLGDVQWCTSVAEPVNITTGNYYSTDKDLSINTKSVPLEFVRSYNSRSDYYGSLGKGWTYNYNSYLIDNQDNSVTVYYGDGHSAVFPWQNGVYTHPAGCFEKLQKNADNTYTLTFKDQLKHLFDSNGRLIQIIDKNDNITQLAYSNSLLTQVTEPGGRSLQFAYYSDGKLQQITDPAGRTLQFGYDANGNMVTFTDLNGGITTYTYGQYGLTSILDPLNHYIVRNTYDDESRVIQQLDSKGQMVAISYDTTNQKNIFTDAMGKTTAYYYDDKYRNTKIEYMDATSVSYTYDNDYNKTSETDARGNATIYTYDTMGNMLTQAAPAPLGYTTTYTYDSKNNPSSITDEAGHITNFTYDAKGNLLQSSKTIDGQTAATSYTYDQYGQVVTITNANGKTSQVTYDQHGNQIQTTDPNNNVTGYTYDIVGKKLTRTDARNHTWTYTYDNNGNLLTETNPLNGVITNTYDAVNHLLSKTDPMGNTTTFSYDENDKLIEITDPLGHSTTITYDANGNQTAVTDANGHTATYTYDDRNRLTGGTDAVGNTESYTLDGNGNILTKTDQNGKVTQYQYDVLNRLTTVIDSLGGIRQIQYDALGNKTNETDAKGQTINYTYNEDAQLLTVTDPLNNTTTYTYDQVGNKLSMTNARGKTWAYTYDDANRLIQVTDPDGYFTEVEYDSTGNLIANTDQNGQTTENTYDELGRLLTETSPLGDTITYAYDANGNQTAVTDANNHTTVYTYDALSRLVTETDAFGHTITYDYDPVGNKLSMTNAKGTWTYDYDDVNRLIKTTDPENHSTRTTYDGCGNIISRIDTNGESTEYTYDDFGRLAQVTDALNQITSYTYDANGNLETITDAREKERTFEYDALNRLITETDPLGNVKAKAYDAVGNLVTRTNPDHETIDYTYDDNNRLIRITYPDQSEVSYSYDPTGKRLYMVDSNGTTTYTYDQNNRLESITRDGDTISYTYDSAGNITGITYPDGMEAEYSFNELNLLDSATVDGQILDIDYDELGLRTGETMPNGVEVTYQYDQSGRLTLLKHQLADTVLAQAAYTLDQNGNRLSITDENDDLTEFTYDPLGQLTEVIYPDGTSAQYTYDPVGNRLTTSGNAPDILETVSGAVYLNYDYEDRLILFQDQNKTINYTYDGDGNLIKKTVTGSVYGDGEEYGYLYDYSAGLPRLLVEKAGDETYNYIYAGRLYSRIGPDGTLYYHQDGLGSILAITDEAGDIKNKYKYDAFGNPTMIRETVENSILFTGELYDQSGFIYLRARYYDPAAGRFITQDTLAGEVDNPLSQNLYAYCGNNPISYTDPSGNMRCNQVDDLLYGLVQSLGESIKGIIHSPLAAWALVKDIKNGNLSLKDLADALGESVAGPIKHLMANSGKVWFGDPTDTQVQQYGKNLGYVIQEAIAVGGAVKTGIKVIDKLVTSTKTAKKVIAAEEKKVPNPYGRSGGPAHQGKIQDIKAKYEGQGYEVKLEYYVKNPGGSKNARYGDLLVTDPKTGEQFIVQIGKKTKTGAPVSREAAAKADLEKAGYKVEFVPYN
ncbi:RHS repeat-associated core domain-containing protein [Candidatus Formimonas warabiya]|uniref:RHS repeat-associated core domain-containing protein n=1 Tax=Formimonas warabiya TaxID=1761012 RepID=UPI001BE47F52|nr:RHS repeat-associated core domain-containing protein [Candidatus Formimonas warabiya]